MDLIANNFDKILIFLAGVGATLLTAFATPYGNQWISRRFARRPAFAITPSRLGSDLKAKVVPLNSLARHKASLNAKIGNIYIYNISKYRKSKTELEWIIDFTPSNIRSAVMQNEKSDVRLFFDADSMSEAMEISRPTESMSSNNRNIVHVDNIQELIASIKSDSKIYTLFERGSINHQFPHTTDHTNWENVIDGKELIIKGVSNIEISGSRTLLLHAARYAWVLVFVDCDKITLNNLILGHEIEGYCLGGVIKFSNCSNIHIKECELFGCGTYGLEFSACRNIEVANSTIRNCTYGIANIFNTSNIAFSDCKFIENREFDLINVDEKTDSLMFQRCLFENNVSSGNLFNFTNQHENYRDIHIWDCTFRSNDVKELSNLDISINYGRNTIE